MAGLSEELIGKEMADIIRLLDVVKRERPGSEAPTGSGDQLPVNYAAL